MLFALLAGLDYGWLEASRIVDQRGGDLLLRWHAEKRPARDEVVVVDIDQFSLEQMNPIAGAWPWPRSVHGELIEYLAAQQPRAIVFDILFNERDVFRRADDDYLAEVVARQPRVYFGTALAVGGQGSLRNIDLPSALGVRPGPTAQPEARSPILGLIFRPEDWRAGMISFAEDSDGVGRHYYLYVEDQGWRFPSLPARIGRDLGWVVPEGERILLNWYRDRRHIAYADLYLDAQRERRQRPADEFRNKIVVVGTAAPGLQDLRVTPLGSTYPGVDVLATAIDNLQAGDALIERPRWWMLPLALGLMAAIAWAFQYGVTATRIALGLAATSVVTVGALWWQLGRGVWWPALAPLLWGWACYFVSAVLAYLKERERREHAVGMFRRFLDPRVVGQLVDDHRVDTAAVAQTRQITVLFSDIRGFTTLSETRSPEFIVDLLNRYFSMQVEIIFKHGGTLDKFIGDAIMAFWGAPADDPDHARHAVAAAIEMAAAVQRFKAELSDLGPDFDIGIGLNTGPAVVGFIGSAERLDYTVIGDTVNLASRIEGQTKGVARVLVAESTRLAAEDFDYLDHGLHHVKGREQGVRLFEPRSKEQTI
ncbi:CHASE2 domain-containing protein [Chitinimonas lacunae]|uniref:CHASE2 domain-containing protein n=1 Tax=Chitinimonas lacunae TaxID=1963018 RepID=A0ABV8MRC8_9NEIS